MHLGSFICIAKICIIAAVIVSTGSSKLANDTFSPFGTRLGHIIQQEVAVVGV